MNTTVIILLVGVVVTFFLSLYFGKKGDRDSCVSIAIFCCILFILTAVESRSINHTLNSNNNCIICEELCKNNDTLCSECLNDLIELIENNK